MKIVVCTLLLSAVFLSGCAQDTSTITLEIATFIDTLKEKGVEGRLDIAPAVNADMEYVATYVISAYTSTRILSFFKFKDIERAEYNLQELMKNPRMTGQTRNGTFVMGATFFPPEPDAVSRIRELFIAHRFDENP